MRVLLGLLLATLLSVAPVAPPKQATPLQQLFILKAIYPELGAVGVMWSKDLPDKEQLLKKIQRAGTSAQVKVVLSELEELRDVPAKFRDMIREYKINAVWILRDDELVSHNISRKFLIEQTTLKGIPLLAPSPQWVEEGALCHVALVDGKVKLQVNQQVAMALNISIPEKYSERTEFLAAR